MPNTNTARLLDDLHKLRSFGRHGSGVIRPSLSETDMAARRWLAERMCDAGLDASIDGIGNVLGRSPNPGPALLVGSHSDTQPTGGWLDGAMGVIYGLEVVRALSEDARTSDFAVDAVAWVDEESTYVSCLGSRAFCGFVTAEEMAAGRSESGKLLGDALEEMGLDGNAAKPSPGRYAGYLEAHIEQGPYLESEQLEVGVVSAIVGSRNFTVRFDGQQNHAGTTPMTLRKDAGRALIDYAYRLNEAFERASGPKTVWTIGRVDFSPGTSSIIPGKADMHLQFRDPDDARLDAFEVLARELAEVAERLGPTAADIEPHSPAIRPARMDEKFQAHLAAAAENHAPGKWCHMPSAAVHDAMFLSQIMPAGMLFVPSIGGVSHDFCEDTSEEDIARGCQVFTSAVAAILEEARAAPSTSPTP